MKSVQKIDLGLTGYDELFMNDAERKENKLPRIYDIPLSEIDDFPDHPFKVKLDEDMDQLVQSIKERGIITPVTLRPKEDGRYEIVSGHRRKKACELAGFDTVKAEVRELTRDEAIILMVESNLQRSVILPSEKAFSYKMRLEAMKRQAGRPAQDNYSPLGNNSFGTKSSDEMAAEVGESKNTIFRYIRLAALHHLDCPWRPSDLQQREGRIIRQGNENKEVDIYTYVTENTFDSYLYQLVESKQKFIGQIMTSKSPVRSAEDIDETALSYAEIKALCAGNPHIKEKMDLDIDVSRLKLLKANHLSQRYALEDQIIKEFPQKIRSLEQRIEGYQTDIDQRKRNTEPNEDGFSPMFMPGGTVREKKAAGDAILGLCKSMTSPDPIPIGQYRGFDMELSFDTFSREYKITLIHQLRHTVTLGTDIFGNIQRLDNTLGAFEERMAACTEQLENTRVQLENAKAEVQKPFPQEEELKTKSARLNELNAMLNLDKRENEIVDGERGDDEPQKSSADRER